MLAKKFEGELKEHVNITLKLDGIRCSFVINHDGTMTAYTRQGKKIEGLKQIENALSNMLLNGYMLDGELIRINADNLPSEENFKLTTSIVNSKDSNKEGLEFVIFDIVPLEDYLRQHCDLTYKQRLNLMIGKIGIGNEYVKMVPCYGTTNKAENVYRILDEVVSEGQEGLMLNTFTGLYKFGKRSSDLLKVKKFNTCDLKIIGFQEGSGKFAGTLGAIICDYKGYSLFVGSGIEDDMRSYIWNHKDDLLGRTAEIKYFEESTNEKGGLSLRFPTFVSIREEGKEVSYD
jgi:DNA ligase-1